MKYPTTRLVFDRKKTATKKEDALIQIEVLYERKKKYITTGVRVYKDQWNDKMMVINRDDSTVLNQRISSVKTSIDLYISDLIEKGIEFKWDSFDRFLKGEKRKTTSFLDFIAQRIEERNDIKCSTKKSHRKIIGSLLEHGRIVDFADLTRANIADYYQWLMGKKIEKVSSDGTSYIGNMSVASAWGYMKILRTYIHDAIVREIIDKDPSAGIKVKKGDYEQTRWLTEEELHKIEDAEMPNGSLARVRDLFIFGCYSGLAYSDLMDFNPEKLEKDGDYIFIYGRRIKTGQEYVVLILPKAKEILEKYEYNLPKYSNQQYNKRLKLVAKAAGIDKEISSHWARITFGFMALNQGVRIEVVSKAMGHATISETQRTYSRILKKTVVNEMKTLI